MGLFQNARQDTASDVFVNLNDSAGTGLTSTLISGKQSLDVNVANAIMIGEPDQSAYAYGTSTFQPIGGVYQDTGAALTAGQAGAFRLNANRGLHINIRNSTGAEIGQDNADGIWVKQGDGTNSQAYSATLEAFTQIRQGGNVAHVTAANELNTIDTNSGSILSLMKPATATLPTPVVLSTSSQVALASNAARKGMAFVNNSNKQIFIAFAASASAAAYTVAMQANAYLEFMSNRVYTGIVSVIGASGIAGSLQITELT